MFHVKQAPTLAAPTESRFAAMFHVEPWRAASPRRVPARRDPEALPGARFAVSFALPAVDAPLPILK